MALNIWALSIVKALGLGYPAFQLVFLRAGVGLLLMLPWILRHRTAFVGLQNLRLHALRVAFSATALTASFFAISRLPLALFTAVGFTRPILTMIAAAWLLREVITRDRWLAALIGAGRRGDRGGPGAGVGRLGAGGANAGRLCLDRGGHHHAQAGRGPDRGDDDLLHRRPDADHRALRDCGLATGARRGQWPALLAIGVFAQSAQFCFLRAHRYGQAGFLSVLSYASLVFSTGAGYLVFGEVPQPHFWVGAALIISATLWISLTRR